MARGVTESGLIHEHLRSNAAGYALVFVLLLTGICFGAAYASLLRDGEADVMSYLESGLINMRVALPGGHGSAFLASLGANLATAGLIWAAGATVIGFPVVLFILFMRGFSWGFTVALMVKEMSGLGAAVAVASVLPHNLVAAPALLVLGTSSAGYAWSVVKRTALRLESDVSLAFTKSVAAALAAAAFLALASFIQVYVSPALLILAARFV